MRASPFKAFSYQPVVKIIISSDLSFPEGSSINKDKAILLTGLKFV
jgi:hypothetical protein